LIEAIFDALIKALEKLVMRSSSQVDDNLVETLKQDRGLIIQDILRNI
jgi:hypothetical protein